MGFAPNNVFYKSLTSIGLQNGELTPNESPKKIRFQIRKRETLNNPNITA